MSLRLGSVGLKQCKAPGGGWRGSAWLSGETEAGVGCWGLGNGKYQGEESPGRHGEGQGATAGLPCDGRHGEARDGERKGNPPRPWGGGSWGELGQLEPWEGCSSCNVLHGAQQRGAAPQKQAQGEHRALGPITSNSPQCTSCLLSGHIMGQLRNLSMKKFLQGEKKRGGLSEELIAFSALAKHVF